MDFLKSLCWHFEMKTSTEALYWPGNFGPGKVNVRASCVLSGTESLQTCKRSYYSFKLHPHVWRFPFESKCFGMILLWHQETLAQATPCGQKSKHETFLYPTFCTNVFLSGFRKPHQKTFCARALVTFTVEKRSKQTQDDSFSRFLFVSGCVDTKKPSRCLVPDPPAAASSSARTRSTSSTRPSSSMTTGESFCSLLCLEEFWITIYEGCRHPGSKDPLVALSQFISITHTNGPKGTKIICTMYYAAWSVCCPFPQKYWF